MEEIGLRVGQWRERSGDPFQQLIREAGIACEHRTVEIRTDHPTADDAIGGAAALRLAGPEWRRIRADGGDTAMVLEADEPSRAEHGVVDRDFADEAFRGPGCGRVDEPQAGNGLAVGAEQ